MRVNAPASQPHFYEHIQESKDVFQEKTYSYQVSFFMGIGHREKHQVGVHWDNGIDCRYHYQSSPKGDFWVSLIEAGSNLFSKMMSRIFSRKEAKHRGRYIVRGSSLFHWCQMGRERKGAWS